MHQQKKKQATAPYWTQVWKSQIEDIAVFKMVLGKHSPGKGG